MPEVQLALVGSMATDDPEGWDFFNATIAHADGDPDIHILNNFNNVGAIEVNAFQSHADVLIQKSTREGFGLTVSEAIWKARPFIGGNVGGIPLQVEDGVSGLPRRQRRGSAPRARSRSSATRRSASALGRARQGARAQALPHAALPARLPADLHASWRSAGPVMPDRALRSSWSPTAGPVTFEDGRRGAARHAAASSRR